MMSLHKLTAGDGYTYLTRQVAALDSTEKGHAGLGDYYSQKGESPGRWLGAGLAGLGSPRSGDQVSAAQMKALFGEGRHPDAESIEAGVLAAGGSPAEALAAAALGARFKTFEDTNAFRAECGRRYEGWNAIAGLPRDWPIPPEERARIRSEVAREMFTAAFGREPVDARELSGLVARVSRPATTAVAGYDLTFSPVKSVSVLWALAENDVSAVIETAHAAAVADALGWLERDAAFTRLGRNGVRQVQVTGLIGAAFIHRDSRAGDPNLHTHVAVSNKVQTRDGRWLALDGRVLYKATVAASERYNTRLEAELTQRLGLAFTEREDTDSPGTGKRAVREVVGVDLRLSQVFSARRAAIETRRAELSQAFQADHGRTPNPVEAVKLAQQATLETRQAKHEPRSLADQRAGWRTQALDVTDEAGLGAMLRDVVGAARREPDRGEHVDGEWIRSTAGAVVSTVQSSRASWQVWHLRGEAERRARAARVSLAELGRVVDAVVDAALGPEHSIPLGVEDPIREPPVLRRSDGASVYTVAGARLFTCAAIVAAEELLLAAAHRRDGRGGPGGSGAGVAGVRRQRSRAEPGPGRAGARVGQLRCPPRPGDRASRLGQDHRDGGAGPGLARRWWSGGRAGADRGRGRGAAEPDRHPHRHLGQADVGAEQRVPPELGARDRPAHAGGHRRGRHGRHRRAGPGGGLHHRPRRLDPPRRRQPAAGQPGRRRGAARHRADRRRGDADAAGPLRRPGRGRRDAGAARG